VNIQRMDVSANQLWGSIPSEVSNLVNIQHMALTDNQLTGSIPSKVGNLVNIQQMDLYDNNLTGSIPNMFCSMDSSPLIRIDCDEVKCECCRDLSSERACPWWSQSPTTFPTWSLSPSTMPTAMPSYLPSFSLAPSFLPSTFPTRSLSPSTMSTAMPSYLPTTPEIPSFSLAPSFLPSTSQSPTQELVNITIEIKFGSATENIGWSITDNENMVKHETSFGAYASGLYSDDTIYEQVSLTVGYEYMFTLFHRNGYGSNNFGRASTILYLGDEPNKNHILGFYNYPSEDEIHSGPIHYEIPFLAIGQPLLQ